MVGFWGGVWKRDFLLCFESLGNPEVVLDSIRRRIEMVYRPKVSEECFYGTLRSRVWFMGICSILGITGACTPLKPYEKEFLLEPVMTDEWPTTLGAPLMLGTVGAQEKLGARGGTGSGGTSCPTCGG